MQKSGIKVRTTGRFFANNTKDYKRDVDICVEAGSDNFRIVLMYLNEQTILDQLKVFPDMVDYIHSQYTRRSPGGSPTCRGPAWN